MRTRFIEVVVTVLLAVTALGAQTCTPTTSVGSYCEIQLSSAQQTFGGSSAVEFVFTVPKTATAAVYFYINVPNATGLTVADNRQSQISSGNTWSEWIINPGDEVYAYLVCPAKWSDSAWIPTPQVSVTENVTISVGGYSVDDLNLVTAPQVENLRLEAGGNKRVDPYQSESSGEIPVLQYNDGPPAWVVEMIDERRHR